MSDKNHNLAIVSKDVDIMRTVTVLLEDKTTGQQFTTKHADQETHEANNQLLGQNISAGRLTKVER